MANPTQGYVFGASADKTASGFGTFGSVVQSTASSTFGSSSQPSSGQGFGVFSSRNESSTQGSSSALSAAPKSGGFGSPLFGGLSNKSPSTFATGTNAFGGQPLFGGSSLNKSPSAGLFKNTAASSGGTLFGAKAGSGSFSSSSSAGSFGSKSTSALFGGAKSITQPNNPFASSLTNTTTSSNVFEASKPLFAAAETGRSSQGTTFAVEDGDGGFRKRSSSGTMGSSVLFGKKQAARAAMAAPTPATHFTSQGTNQLFKTSPRESVSKPAAEGKVFGKNLSPTTSVTSSNQGVFDARLPSYSESRQTFSNNPQSSFSSSSPSKTPFSSNLPETGPSRVREVFTSAPSVLFGKPALESGRSNTVSSNSGTSTTTASSLPSFHLFKKVDPPLTSGNVFAPTAVSSASTSSQLFGKSDPSGKAGSMAAPISESSSSRQLFGKVDSSSKAFFGKADVKKEQVLFGKKQPGAGLFGVDQTEPKLVHHGENSRQGTDFQQEDKASSPSRRSLSKWNRNRDLSGGLEKKRSGEEAEERETKRPRGSDNQAHTKGSPPAALLSHSRQSSVDDLSQKTSIIVRDIPVSLNKGSFLRKHFSRFGTIKRLQPIPTKNYANVTFETHEEAKAAKNSGKHLGGGKTLNIFWRNTSGRSPRSAQATSATQSPEGESKLTFELKGHVQDELTSMAGTFDDQEEITPMPPRMKSERPGSQTISSPKRKPQTRAADRRSPTPPRKHEEETESQSIPDIDIAKKLLGAMVNARPKDATEVVAVLDARDKFLRMLQRRQSDLASAKAFTGTCEDMCAEKERYYREDIRRLALYEVIPSTMTSLTGQKSKVDHARAVKEYSRSSADQEEPLPHELRPLRVLKITMNYLLSELADLGGEGKWSEWYDFLWNRTRGIRKDITQQQLCEVDVAELLEKCTRFHIFCSARLCEEDMMSFDAKINNENLTKCLQTIKELYADLEKKGVYCPNEAEFRANMVLMNLNEGDTLREVQQLRPEIRESPQINFAVRAYHALNSRNYVRFFRLINEATFLQACALHRYFNQIRGQALRIIMKSLGATGKYKIMYPVQELARLLKFEDRAQVENFCDHYCLSVEGGKIVMDAQAFLEPETSIPETRSPSLVEAKRTVSVGEIINGGRLPPLLLPTPTSSFDHSGTFIIPLAIKEALSKGLTGLRLALSSHAERPGVEATRQQPAQEGVTFPDREGLPNAAEVQRGRALYSNEAIKSIVRSLILEELDMEMQGLAKEAVAEEMHRGSLLMEQVTDVTAATVQELARELTEEVVQEEEAKFRQKLAQEMAAQRQRVFSALCEGVVEDTLKHFALEVAKDEMILVNKELHRQCMERCSLNLRDDMLTVATESMILDVAQDVFEVDVLAKRERLAATESCVLGLRCRRFFQMWQRKYISQIRVKRAMLDFPSTAPNRSLSEQMQRLIPHRPDNRLKDKSFYISDRTKLTVQTPMEVIQQQLYLSTHLSMASARCMLAGLALWKPLDLSDTVAPQLCKSYSEWIEDGLVEPDIALLQWKLCVSLPKKEPSTTELETNFVKWIRAKLCKDSERDALLKTTPSFEGEVLSLYHLNVDNKKGRPLPLGLCIRAFHGKWTDDQELKALQKDVLKGMSALVFVCSTAEDLRKTDSSEKTSAWNLDRLRLHQMLKQKSKVPKVPVVVIVPRVSGESVLSTGELDRKLQLSKLHREGLLSMAHVSQIYIGAQGHPTEFLTDWTSQLSNSLRFAAGHVPTPPKLWAKPVSSYVEDVVIELYKAPVYQDLRTRTRLQLLHQSPNTLITLYNDVIEHLALACASDDVRLLSWPAPEFDKSTRSKKSLAPTSTWNTEAHLCDLYELVVTMSLPRFRYSDMEAQDWSTACRDVWAFLNMVTKKDSGSAKIALFQQTAQLLIRSKKRFDQLCWLSSEDGPCEPTYTNMMWTDLIDACIQYKLLCLRSGHSDIRKPGQDDDGNTQKAEDFEEVIVYYHEDELNDFESPASWIDALRDTETSERGQLKQTVELAAAKRDETVVEQSTLEGDTMVDQPAEAHAHTYASSTFSTQVQEDKDDSWAIFQRRLEQEKAASEKFLSQLAAAVSPLEKSPGESLVPPYQFGAQFSPIFAHRNEANASGSESKKQTLSSSTLTPSEPKNAARSPIVTTPRRPLAKSNRSLTAEPSSQPVSSDASADDNGLLDDQDHQSDHQSHTENGTSLWQESTLSERVSSVRDRVASQKQEDVLFEMKLRRMMDSSPLLL
ncbi:mcm3 minichromosome maintenance deficient 3associated protein [Plakobranchus ocellatus]|uniref:Germinal-center associated nuclear protein n=1 Tax=Plakobranchus ocellatus TaxID=259542 RepID=A0AAV4BWQ1_9GAST|nr:mcm3 minichromosome maintenance deficient 3associated protein [Plakobranchus ocellatus]